MQEKFWKIVSGDCVFEQEPLRRHSTFRIGGPADILVTPRTEAEIAALIQLCRESGIPFIVIGNGSNLLFDDRGFRGCVIQLTETFGGIDETAPREGTDASVTFFAKAGTSLARAAAYAHERVLTGLEFAAGIPGSVGGAVLMNAGAYGGEISQCVTKSRYLDISALKAGDAECIRTYAGEEHRFSYRHSRYQEIESVILGAFFTLRPGVSREEIGARMRELNSRRREKQPLEYPSAGSAFKRPRGDFAGRLIEAAGMKGFRVGDAMISTKHSGFIVNVGKATAEDVLQVLETVRERVFRESGVTLETEIKIIKEWDGWNL